MPAAHQLSRRVVASSGSQFWSISTLSWRHSPPSMPLLRPIAHSHFLSTSSSASAPNLYNLYSQKPPLPPLSNLSSSERWTLLKHAHNYASAGRQAGLSPPQILHAAQAEVSAGRLSPDGYAVVANVATPRGWRATAMLTVAYTLVAVGVANLYWKARGRGTGEVSSRVEMARQERMKRMEGGADKRDKEERQASRRSEWLKRLGKAQERVKVAEAPRARRIGRTGDEEEA